MKSNKKIDIALHTENCIRDYGKYTIEQRVLPDFRDGLKPVQRRILWTMYKLGLKCNAGRTKAARISGITMGQYHPHSQQSIDDAMVTLANSSVKIIDGQGNWGDYDSEAGAGRYIEARLSKYSDLYFLDKECLNVTEMLPNYDNTEKEPLFLPSLLPNLLLNGCGGIAVGTNTRIPPFKINGVLKLVKKVLNNKKITERHCLKYLDFNFVYGAKCISSKNTLLSYYKNGNGTLVFSCEYKIDKENKQLTIVGLDPFFTLERTYKNIMEIDGVKDFLNKSSDSGIKLVVGFKHSLSDKDLDIVIEDVEKELQVNLPCYTNITIRKSEKVEGILESNATFKATNIPELITMWTKWRVSLEKDRLEYRLKDLREQLEYQKLLLLAVSKLDIIMKILKKKTSTLDEDLSKALRITKEQSKLILDRQTRSLSRLSGEKINKEIKDLKSRINDTKIRLKNPSKEVLQQLKYINI